MGSFTKNKSLEIGAVVGGVGLVLTVLSWTYKFADAPAALAWWGSAMQSIPGEGDYNLLAFVIGPVLLIGGAWYVGEQIVLRRRFERLIRTDKRSEFTAAHKQLEELTRRLPDAYRQRMKAWAKEFRNRRTA